jgi:hypothetical protein
MLHQTYWFRLRRLRIRVGETATMREPPIPEERLARVNPPPPPVRNILDDAVGEAFNMACSLGELKEAAELLALMAGWHARRSYPDENARRHDKIKLLRMHGELERRHILKGTKR